MLNEKIGIRGRVVAILTNAETGLRREFVSKNIVVDTGDVYYAQVAKAAVSTPTSDFGGATGRIVCLDNTGLAPLATHNWSNIGSPVGSGNPKAFEAGYPQVDDPDADNTGSGPDVLSYETDYTTAEANGVIDRVSIHLNGASGTDPLLMYANFGAQFTKTASDTLKVFVNHQFTGI